MASKKKQKMPYVQVGNFALAVAMVEKRTSNAAGKHADKRTKRMRTRSAAKNASLSEWR